jgi:hypothetical protein
MKSFRLLNARARRARPRDTARHPGRAGRPILRLALLATLAGGAFLAAYGLTRLHTRGEPEGRPPGMVWVPGGDFTMGTDSELGWPDERPAHRVRVDGFWMNQTEVTNAQFRAFVEATGHVTTAEKAPTLEEIMRQVPPGTPPPAKEKLVPGSLVFTPTAGPVKLDDFAQWWKWTPGASWRHPEGPGSSIEGRDEHPVVHVSWDDANAYARWAGKRLPPEGRPRRGCGPDRAGTHGGPDPSLHAAAGAARRVVPVQRQLLLALPAERPARVQPGHRHVARRLPLRARRRPEEVTMARSLGGVLC